MGLKSAAQNILRRSDKRAFARVPVSLPGKLFLPEDLPRDCAILNLSCGGAAIQCDDTVWDSDAVLYIEHIGRVPVVGRRRNGGLLGLEFECSDRKRWEVGYAVAQYLTDGVTQLTRLRRRERQTVADIAVTRTNGEIMRCDAINISSSGMALRSKIQPPVGEILRLENNLGRVVRHHAGGFVIEFVQAGPSHVVPFARPLDVSDPDPDHTS